MQFHWLNKKNNENSTGINNLVEYFKKLLQFNKILYICRKRCNKSFLQFLIYTVYGNLVVFS